MDLKNTSKLLSQKMNNRDFDSYAVFVSKNGVETFLHSENVDEDTYFDIASMGKILVTSPLILQAIGENKLSLEDQLGNFFEHVPQEKNVTIKQLLTHTSGIVRCPILPEAAAKGREAVAAQIIDFPLAFEPGTNYVYSCNGMILLGFILEKLYGVSLESLFETKLKGPLGYTRSKFNIAVGEPNAAVSYRSENVDGLSSPWDDENVRVLQTSAGSGGQFFTLRDIKKYAEAILSKSELLYPKELYDIAEKDYTEKTFTEGRGLGWLIVDERYAQTGKLFPSGSFGHCGHTGTSLFFSRAENMYVILLTNATRFQSMKNHFTSYDYNVVCKMREEIHNAIHTDLIDNHLISRNI